jgi:hypothetical protein
VDGIMFLRCHHRRFGDCWLGLTLWRQLGLEGFWSERLGRERGAVDWSKVLAVLVINRLCQPASEFAVHRRWFLGSAMDELLGVNFAVADKDRLYRCLDRLGVHEDALFTFLVNRWKTLFDARFDVLLYDLTSTYFEGRCERIPKAKHGYSRDGRPDCRQVVIALVVTPDGFPLAYEVMPGNTSDLSACNAQAGRTTLQAFLAKIESMYGRSRRVWLMDRGVPTEEDLERMRSDGVGYLACLCGARRQVGTPKRSLDTMEQALLDPPWQTVHEGMRVKWVEQGGELVVLAESGARRAKENAIRRRKFKAFVHGLNRLKRKCRDRDHLLERLAVLRKEAGGVARFVAVRKPKPDEPVNPRGRGLINCQQALEAAGCHGEAAAVQSIRNKKNWSVYATELVKNVQASVRKYSNTKTLRFLLYPTNLLPEHKAQIRQDDEGVVWLGKR